MTRPRFTEKRLWWSLRRADRREVVKVINYLRHSAQYLVEPCHPLGVRSVVDYVAQRRGAKAVSTRGMKFHRHKCAECGRVWRHKDGADYHAHFCPSCGEYEDVVYQPGEELEQGPAFDEAVVASWLGGELGGEA